MNKLKVNIFVQISKVLLAGLVVIILCFGAMPLLAQVQSKVDWPKFMQRNDMVWDRMPKRWEVAPYSGNGNMGFLLYQGKGEAKNVMSIHVGRHDHYDHRLPFEGNEMLWIYRGRLPLGHFKLTSKGDVVDLDMRLGLWNAELVGEIKTTKGSYKIHGLTHSLNDVIYFKTDAGDGESIEISWHPDEPISSVREKLQGGRGPKGKIWDKMRAAPYPMPEKPVLIDDEGITFCLQKLYQHRGETTTGWGLFGKADGEQVILASVHHSFPEKNSVQKVKDNIQKAESDLREKSFFLKHREWWHCYYPKSFLTINDSEKEAFYWIQMYKLGSAMRQDGPILDLMGPWYHSTFWPMVWGDLNVQLIYWTHLTSNRMSVGESLPNNVDKYKGHLENNGPKEWVDSANIATLFPQNMDAKIGKVVPDMLAWVLHNYWLHCEYAGDRERMRDGLFPVLRQTVNTYLHYLKENPLLDKDGTIHVKNSWSPEYPGGRGKDVNFTLGLIRWSCQTLLDIDKEHGLNDPFANKWQEVIDRLVGFQIDEDGLRIGKDIPFDKPHRHYSHLLPFYPLAVITPEGAKDKVMLGKSLDHWLDVTFNQSQQDKAMPVTGYTATGAASMYAWLGDSEKAYHYLDFLIKHKNVSSTTMYAEGNPVIESPLSFATSIHDMLLQSWGGKIRVFPASPKRWGDVGFHQFRTHGAFLVSAKKVSGETHFVNVMSEFGGTCVVQIDIENPIISIDGVKRDEAGFYHVHLRKGESVLFTAQGVDAKSCSIDAIPVGEEKHHLFGFSKKTESLPGHQFYAR